MRFEISALRAHRPLSPPRHAANPGLPNIALPSAPRTGILPHASSSLHAQHVKRMLDPRLRERMRCARRCGVESVDIELPRALHDSWDFLSCRPGRDPVPNPFLCLHTGSNSELRQCVTAVACGISAVNTMDSKQRLLNYTARN